MVFYAVAKGRTVGVFTNWPDCNTSVKGFVGPVFKKFDTKEEAENFLLQNLFTIQNVIEEDTVDTVAPAKTKAKRTTIQDISSSHSEPDYYVYTDGSCSNNGRSNAKAGIGIYFGENDPRNVSQRIDGKQTNNTAELTAILQTYDTIQEDIRKGKTICIVSDSEYSIRCVTTYGKKCMESNWEKDMPNKDLVKRLYERYKDFTNVTFLHIMAHTGKNDIHSIGNDGADRLANLAIGLEHCPYSNKIFLNVPFAQKDVAKQLGASWAPDKKKWYIYEGSTHKDQLVQMFGIV